MYFVYDRADFMCVRVQPGACVHITAAIEAFPIRNQSGITLGSESPWLEGIALACGARHIMTVEYGKIFNQDTRISAATPTSVAALMLSGCGTIGHAERCFNVWCSPRHCIGWRCV